ncbi:MAG: SDR family oxidoreductase [Desulfurivibrionaceae bacterium]|nr:SDR family NAD(P)-dependent oxidoreductase [Desulfobulbales bacterium]MDT8334675.1 SDR family oxidoreductase [Desulfurivibrionaceae bacterium]
MKLKGKHALVLGGGKGIGKEIAFYLAGRGVTVAITYFDWPKESTDTRERLKKLGGGHLAVKVDLRRPAAIERMIKELGAKFTRLDILINNIERGGMPVVHGEYTSDQWDLELETTLKAKRWVFRHTLPLLKESGDGAVINVSSIAGLTGRCGPAGLIFNDGYSAANRAISLLTETWAREGAPEVRVNELMLGFFETRHARGTRGWALLSPEERRAIIGHTLLGRSGRTPDVIKAVRYLLEDGDYLTGATLRVDGGYVLGGSEVPPMPKGVP